MKINKALKLKREELKLKRSELNKRMKEENRLYEKSMNSARKHSLKIQSIERSLAKLD